jgi:hypothetical protein
MPRPWPRPGRPPLVFLYKQGLIPTNPHSHRSQFPLPLLHYRGGERAPSRSQADGGRPRQRRLQQLGPGRRRTPGRRTTTTRSSHCPHRSREDTCLFINPDYVAPVPVTGMGKGNQMLPIPKKRHWTTPALQQRAGAAAEAKPRSPTCSRRRPFSRHGMPLGPEGGAHVRCVH